MMSTTHWPKHFYLVGSTADVNHKPSKDNMGSKAFNLLRMAEIGLLVPPALVIGTPFTKNPETCMAPLFETGLPALEELAGENFGDARNPLIVSVRSGAPVSMPGMMETLLNVGICDETISGLLRKTGNPRLVWDAYRRLIATYGEVVAGLPGAIFEDEIQRVTQGRDERTLDFGQLRELTRSSLAIYQLHAGHPFPQDVKAQLSGAVRAVFDSWQSEKAKAYRHSNDIDPAIGTAVTIQKMVFGNSGAHSGAGVGFTRNPTTGAAELWIDFLGNAQGEDVVSGRRNADAQLSLVSAAPEAWHKLLEAAQALEREFADMQDFEFTVQDSRLYMLQTRAGKRTNLACARIALDLLEEKQIDADTALQRTSKLVEDDIGTMRLVSQDFGTSKLLAAAISACPGVASGEVALDAKRVEERVKAGASVILLRQDAETSDMAALELASGLLTQRGARTSHAAVVARQLGKVCLVGCKAMQIDMATRTVRVGQTVLQEGDVVSIDGNDGSVYLGAMVAAMVPDQALLERLRALRKSEHARPHHKHES